jgi:hypothetical protein
VTASQRAAANGVARAQCATCSLIAAFFVQSRRCAQRARATGRRGVFSVRTRVATRADAQRARVAQASPRASALHSAVRAPISP